MKASYKPSELVKEARHLLRQHEIPENGADWLMMDLFDITQMEMLMDMRVLSEAEFKTYQKGLSALVDHVPLAHITGFQEFYGRKFTVNPDVLVPRPETEELIQAVLSEQSSGTLADIGVGSGAIAVTLALEGAFDVHAVDISDRALEVARRNAAAMQADVTFYHGDLLQPLIDADVKLDVLVSNPPYIAEAEKHLMSRSVLEYDPHIALFAEDDGLALYKRMVDRLPEVMKPDGVIFFEMGHAQGEQLKQYITQAYDVKVHIQKDINQLDRILWFKWCE